MQNFIGTAPWSTLTLARCGEWWARYASSQVRRLIGSTAVLPHCTSDGEWKLIVVTQASYVDLLPHGGNVYCVDKIGIIPLSSSSAEIIGMEVRLPC